MAATAEALAADEEAPLADAPSLARSIPGSVEAAALIVVVAAWSLAVGVRGPLFLVLCASGLMFGKPWWRELTFWLFALSLLVALVLFHADLTDALRSPHMQSGLLLSLGSFMFALGLAALVFPSGWLERSGVRAWTACAAVGLLLVFVARLCW